MLRPSHSSNANTLERDYSTGEQQRAQNIFNLTASANNNNIPPHTPKYASTSPVADSTAVDSNLRLNTNDIVGSTSGGKVNLKFENNISSNANTADEPLSISFTHNPFHVQNLSETRTFLTSPSAFSNTLNSVFNSTINNTNIDTLLDDSISKTDSNESITSYTSNISSDVNRDKKLSSSSSIRKKSGELVKSSLKVSRSAPDLTDRPAKSLPSTPTFHYRSDSKRQVHFGGDDSIDIRYFKSKDRPTAISASNSPKLISKKPFNWNLTDDDYYDLFDDEDDDADLTDMESIDSELDLSYFNNYIKDWELSCTNFPSISYDDLIKSSKTVFLERIFLSSDKKFIIGHIAVKNLSFEKSVIVRYTLDDWESVIEVAAGYIPDIPRNLKKHNYDRFIFKISLTNIINSFQLNYLYNNSKQTIHTDSKNTKIFHLCVKYITLNKEFWDNNNYKNFEIKLTRQRLDGYDNHVSGRSTKTKNRKPVLAMFSNSSQNEEPFKFKFNSNFKSDPYSRIASSKFKSHDYMKNNESESTITKDSDRTGLNSASNINDSVPDYKFDSNFRLHTPMSSYKFPSTDTLPTSNIYSNANNALLNSNISSFYFHSPLSSIDNSTSIEDDFTIPSSVTHLSKDSAASSNNYTKDISPTRDFAQLAASNKGDGSVLESKTYQELLDTYCFFKKPVGSSNMATVSSVLNVSNNV